MLETSLGIGLITVGGLSLLAGLLLALNPFNFFGRKAGASDASASPALSTVVEGPAPMWVEDPDAQAPMDEESLGELFAEIFSLRSMVGDLSRDVRTLKLQVASLSEDDQPRVMRRAA